MDGRADGGPLSPDGEPRSPRASELQRPGARGEGEGVEAQAADPDRLRQFDWSAGL
jgi:hypothetical protein